MGLICYLALLEIPTIADYLCDSVSFVSI